VPHFSRSLREVGFCNKKSVIPERNLSRAKRTTNVVEGPLLRRQHPSAYRHSHRFDFETLVDTLIVRYPFAVAAARSPLLCRSNPSPAVSQPVQVHT